MEFQPDPKPEVPAGRTGRAKIMFLRLACEANKSMVCLAAHKLRPAKLLTVFISDCHHSNVSAGRIYSMLCLPPNDRQLAAARKANAIRLDSIQNIPPRICRLPAQVVETRIAVAGNTTHKKSLALAVRCIGLVVNMTSGRTIGAETEDGYSDLNRDGVGMPAGREASGPLEASLWDGLNQARFVV